MKKKEVGDRSAKPSKETTFEQALARLERIVERLEGGEETLESSMRLYEEAVRLSRFCDEQMRAAQERIEKLAETDNEPQALPAAAGHEDVK